MPKRTVLMAYYMDVKGGTHYRGEEFDASDEDAARGDKLGAFVESEDPGDPSSASAAHGDEKNRMGGVHTALGSPAPERKSAKKAAAKS
jgi:hypothetical protein